MCRPAAKSNCPDEKNGASRVRFDSPLRQIRASEPHRTVAFCRKCQSCRKENPGAETDANWTAKRSGSNEASELTSTARCIDASCNGLLADHNTPTKAKSPANSTSDSKDACPRCNEAAIRGS